MELKPRGFTHQFLLYFTPVMACITPFFTRLTGGWHLSLLPGGWGPCPIVPSVLDSSRSLCSSLPPHSVLLLDLWRRWHAFSLLSGKILRVPVYTHIYTIPFRISCSSFSSDSISQESFCSRSRPEQTVLFYTLTDSVLFLPSACMWLCLSLSLSIKSGIIVSPALAKCLVHRRCSWMN